MSSRSLSILGCVVVALTCAPAALAQPLVTGELTLYYDFDEDVDGQILDESGNGFHGEIVEGGDNSLVIDTVDPLRGPGAGVFEQYLGLVYDAVDELMDTAMLFV